VGPLLFLDLSRAVPGNPVVADNLRALPPAPVPPFTAALGHPVIWPACWHYTKRHRRRPSGALVPGRVGCGRAPSSVCRRATSTRAAYDRARTSDGVVDSCFARHCGLDASRPGAWSFTGDPRTPAVGTSLDASTRVPSTCNGSDRDRRESARERAIHEHSTVAHGRWTMQCPSDGEPPRTAANL
jgi:hypothetical protein